jgi:cation transport regulator
MVYQTNRQLPLEIRTRLSEKAQDFYRVAYNCAVQWYGEDQKAHAIAWSAVRSQHFSLNSVIDVRSVAV